MTATPVGGRVATTDAGLCATCVHQRLVPTTRGSVFSLCERSRAQREFPRYPRLPVLACGGHEPRTGQTPATR